MMTVEEIEKFQPGRNLDKIIEEIIFRRKGLGYYGPPVDFSFWEHIKSVKYDSYEEAKEAYKNYWEVIHKDKPQGYIGKDEFDADLCYWQDGWGPRHVLEYSSYLTDAWHIVDKIRERFSNVSLHGSNGWGLTCFNIYDSETDLELFSDDRQQFIERNIVGPVNADTPALAICRTALLVNWDK